MPKKYVLRTVSTGSFTYIKERKMLVGELYELRLSGFPSRLAVQSMRTGRVVVFEVDQQKAMDAEYWDGEECHYKGVDPVASRGVRLVLIND